MGLGNLDAFIGKGPALFERKSVTPILPFLPFVPPCPARGILFRGSIITDDFAPSKLAQLALLALDSTRPPWPLQWPLPAIHTKAVTTPLLQLIAHYRFSVWIIKTDVLMMPTLRTNNSVGISPIVINKE